MKINTNNIKEILHRINNLNNKTIDTIKYDITKDRIDIKFDNIKLSLSNIKECDIREYYSWEKIEECYLEFVQFNNQDSICFATNKNNPSLYIVCDEAKITIK